MTKEFRTIICISWTTLLLFTAAASGQTFPFHRADIHTGTGPQRVAVGDFNNDGISDIAAPNYAEGSVSILLCNGGITSNAAIVPAGPGGVIKVYATDVTDLILDISGYFAP